MAESAGLGEPVDQFEFVRGGEFLGGVLMANLTILFVLACCAGIVDPRADYAELKAKA